MNSQAGGGAAINQPSKGSNKAVSELSAKIIRELVIPEIEKGKIDSLFEFKIFGVLNGLLLRKEGDKEIGK